MFEVGRYYDVETSRGGDWSRENGLQLVEVALPLIKVRNYDGEEKIINTSSSEFVSAQLSASQSGKLPLLVMNDDGSSMIVQQ